MSPHILAIDDDRTVLRLIEKAFSGSDTKLSTCSSAESGLELIVDGGVDVCLLDIMLPNMSGLDLARKIRSIDARLPVIFITSMDDSGTAIEAMKLGAYEFCTKPLDVRQVQDLVERALEARRLMRSPVTFKQPATAALVEGDLLVGKSPQMVDVYKQVGRVAAQQVPVLIRGESGTGKELIARAIYQHSHRQDNCFLAVNCAALKANSSAMKKARSPAPTVGTLENSNSAARERFSWTKLVICHRYYKVKRYGCCRNKSSNESVAQKRLRLTHESFPRATATSNK